MNQLFDALADLLEYPGEDSRARLESTKGLLPIHKSDLVVQFILFRRSLRTLSIAELQELYTRTFDLNPVCTLDIGYHLFGENYKRGELLARLRETEADYELGQANQLPDYLPVLLRLLGKLADPEIRHSLIVELLTPAVGKMVQTFGDSDNPYRYLIEVVECGLRNECGNAALPLGHQIPELYRITSSAAARH
jgi:nitrate reductase molybdenum cofactor assembly chaperone NarJ/NarW